MFFQLTKHIVLIWLQTNGRDVKPQNISPWATAVAVAEA